jgi:hypothetical protein
MEGEIIKKRKRVASISIKAGKSVDLRIGMLPMGEKEQDDERKAYNAARLRVCEALDKIANSKDMVLIREFNDLANLIEGEYTKFAIGYAFRENATQNDMLLHCPPGWTVITYDKNDLTPFQ